MSTSSDLLKTNVVVNEQSLGRMLIGGNEMLFTASVRRSNVWTVVVKAPSVTVGVKVAQLYQKLTLKVCDATFYPSLSTVFMVRV